MSKTLRALIERKNKAVTDAKALNAKSETEKRELNDDERTQIDAHLASVEKLNADIERQKALDAAEKSAVGIDITDPSAVGNPTPAVMSDPKRGYPSFGQFAQDVRKAMNSETPERLRIAAAAPTTFGNEGAGADGGFLIPPQYAQDIFTQSLGEDSLLPMTDNYTVTGNSMVFPKDETTPWGTDGIRANWLSEASAAAQTKPKLGATPLRLHKLIGLVPLTDELLDDASALGQYVVKKAGDSIRWKTNEAILFGNGNGQPQGCFNGSAAVTIAKESGQATQTLQAVNLAKMIARLPAGSYGRAVWMLNNDVLPALFTLSLSNYPIYLPTGGPSAGGIAGNPYGTLLGRPVIVTQHAKSFSAQGDVLLADLSYVRSITKAAGVTTATSMHLYFDADATAYRITFRVDAQPTIATSIKPANGSNNLSPFVQLGAR